MLKVNASMNAASPRMAPAIAETGDSFSSSDRRCMACPSRYPASMATITTTIVPAKTAHIGMASMRMSDHRECVARPTIQARILECTFLHSINSHEIAGYPALVRRLRPKQIVIDQSVFFLAASIDPPAWPAA